MRTCVRLFKSTSLFFDANVGSQARNKLATKRKPTKHKSLAMHRKAKG